MDKKILVYNESKEEYKTVTFQEQVISVKTRLNVEDVSRLMATYISEYFNEEEAVEARVMLAEYGFSSTLFDLVTNYSIPDDIFTEVVNSGLFEEVESKIENLYEVEDLIFKTVQKIQSEQQVSKKLSELTDKIYGLIDNFSSMSLDEDFLDKISQTAREIKELGIEKETPSFLKKEKEEDVPA